MIAVARNKHPDQDSAGKPSQLAWAEKRTGGKRAKRDSIQPPSEPDSKAVIDDGATGLISQAKKMRGILSHKEYASSDDGFGALKTQSVLTYVAQGEVFVDAAYLARNFRSAKIGSRDDRGTR